MRENKIIYRSLYLWLAAIWIFSAQSLGAAAEIAIIKSNDIGPYNEAVTGFKSLISADLREYDLKGQPDKADHTMKEIQRHPPNLVFAVGALAVSKAREWLPGTPVVCAVVLNAKAGEISGSNTTCISIEIEPETQLAALERLIPKVKTVGMLFSKTTENVMNRAQEACKKKGIMLVFRRLERPEDVPQAVQEMLPVINALWLIPDGTVVNKDSVQYLLLTTLENRIAFMVYTPNFVKAGALFSVSVDYIKIGRQAAVVSRKILQGQSYSIGTLPPEEVDLSVNRNTAQRLGIDIPQPILDSARHVFQ